jgi:hypothetical protein
MSALPRTADILRLHLDVRLVPIVLQNWLEGASEQ